MPTPAERLCGALARYVKCPTSPVGVKLAAAGEVIPQKASYPLESPGHRLAVCQGMTLSRTLGWTMAFRKQDHGCPMAQVFLGHIRPEVFLSGKIAGPYQKDAACARAMEAAFPRHAPGKVAETWLAPLDRCAFAPDLAVIYGTPAQVLALIQGANFGRGEGIRSRSGGRGGCSAWLAGVVAEGACTYMVPGPGERVFAGTQDHEMSFAVPAAEFDNLAEGLAYVHAQGAYRYPVPNLAVLSEPRIPAAYFSLDPEADTR